MVIMIKYDSSIDVDRLLMDVIVFIKKQIVLIV